MSLYYRILIPTDGSSDSESAVDHGLAIAKLAGADVTVLSIIDTVSPASTLQGLTPTPAGWSMSDVANSAVSEATKKAANLGIRVRKDIRTGNPATEIIKMSIDYDLVVMGTKGRTGLPHLLIGSVAEKVVREAKCPVTVVKSSKK